MASEYVVERRERIGAPPSAIYERIIDLHRWQAWSPWEELDPDLRRDYSGPDQGVGAQYGWEGNRKAGKGHMEIVATEPDRRVVTDVRFLKPFRSRSTSTFALQPDGDGTLVTWTMTGPHTVLTRAMGIFTSMDKMIGNDFEKGLARLKADAEAG